MPDQERSRAVALRRHEIDPGVSRPRLRGEIDEHDDGEIEPFAAVDREQADGVVVLREDDALRLVRLVGDAAIEPPRERRERAAALPGDGDEAVDVGEPRLRAREGGEHAIEIEARDEGSQRFAGRGIFNKASYSWFERTVDTPANRCLTLKNLVSEAIGSGYERHGFAGVFQPDVVSGCSAVYHSRW